MRSTRLGSDETPADSTPTCARVFTQWLDLDKTLAEIARFSTRDAESYARAFREYDEVASIIGRARLRPDGMGASTEESLKEHPAAASSSAATPMPVCGARTSCTAPTPTT